MLALLRDARCWFACLVIWLLVLWLLSSRTGDAGGLPPIPGLDKVAHFGYFAGGGWLLAGFLFRLRPDRPRWGQILVIVFVIAALMGWVDEYHQSHVPGRSGNDFGDWIADVTGAVTGALALRLFHRRFL